jgi:hypothetical protein
VYAKRVEVKKFCAVWPENLRERNAQNEVAKLISCWFCAVHTPSHHQLINPNPKKMIFEKNGADDDKMF